MDEIELLKQASLFKNLGDSELKDARALMEQFTFVPGQTIIREHEEGKYVYVIVSGTADALITDLSGIELFLEKIGPGGLFGELSMLTGEPRMACVRAVDEVKALALDRAHFHEFLVKHPRAAIEVLNVISRRLYNNDKLLRQSVSRNVNKVIDEKQTLGQLIADRFAAVMGSWTFIVLQTLAIALWIVFNTISSRSFDIFPFVFLNLVLGFQAAYAAPIIMMSQNRQSEKDRLVAEIDHEVNVKAEIKAGLIVARLNDLERSMHFLHQELMTHVKK
ncbi:MAG TPA: DUF1003 domain-containing protein [Planctomycetota bacterium]|nr:DUF1003 domain-containing protein [Planctomycetota bacterium]